MYRTPGYAKGCAAFTDRAVQMEFITDEAGAYASMKGIHVAVYGAHIYYR